MLTPLRPLLSTKNDFKWSPTHDQAFQVAKEHLTVALIPAFFDINKPTRLCTDASRHGLGFILQQQNPDGKWTLTQAGSLFLLDAECCYAIIELEMLAVCWAIWAILKCHTFLAGLQQFQLITYYNLLIPYGGKLLWWEMLANLANDLGFAKFIPAKFYPVKESLT